MSSDWFTRAFKALDDQQHLIDRLAAVTAERESDRIAYELLLNTATAERDMLSELAQRQERQLSVALDDSEKLRVRLAAIDNAPTVAWASTDLSSVFVDDDLAAKCADVRELIPRPAKDNS